MGFKNKPLIIVSIVIVLFIGLFSVFDIYESERGVIKRLGKIRELPQTNQARILEPGLHFKLPFIDTVLKFDTRIQTLQVVASRIPTAEKKELIIDLFTKWKIVNLAQFYQATKGGDLKYAETLLKQKVIEVLRTEIGQRNLSNVVSEERQAVLDKLGQEANKAAKTLGVEVVDVRIVRLDLPDEVSEAVYNLMRTERGRVAAEHRARGQSRAEAIRADADAQETIILANAEREAKTLQGDGEAQAARIFSDAYSLDPEFYGFLRSLDAYNGAFTDKNGLLVIKPDGEFFKYFHQKKGGGASSSPSSAAKP